MSISFLTHKGVRLAIAAVVLGVAPPTVLSAQDQTTEYTVVSSFDIAFRNGRVPSSLRQADNGTFYGTTRAGGFFDGGTLFRMDATGVVTLLESFSGSNGAGPFGLVRAADGLFYGLTSGSGAAPATVFRFTPGGGLTTLHSFQPFVDGFPVELVPASDGNVYGLTTSGGDFFKGMIFAIDPSGGFRVIYRFPPSAGSVMSSLVRGSDGRFYGTAEQGGEGEFGTVFRVDEAGTLTILHSFTFLDGDGATPSGLIQASDGRLYGTTRSGGEFGDGTVYSIDLAGNYRILHSFNLSVDGSQPGPDLLEANDGNFYGVTLFTARLFRMDSSGTVTVLDDLTGLAPGELIQGIDGRLYGPTARGGSDDGGTIIRLDPAETLTTVYQFLLGAESGTPNGVIQARNGQFYGTTRGPAANGTIGTVFAMDAAGARTTLHEFKQSIFTVPRIFDGTPLSNLFEGADGRLYGTTFNPLDSFTGSGQIFAISPAGDFTRVSSAFWLVAGVIQARDGRLYGTDSGGVTDPSLRTYGSVFKVEPSGTLSALHRFGADTGRPVAELVEIDDGSLYGTTQGDLFFPPGGGFPQPTPATIFQVDPATGSFTIRHSFSGPDGSRPAGRLIQGTDGLIYGTTVAGGAFGLGTVFSLDRAGTLTTLHHFAGPDGANPNAGVLQGLDGRLYGTSTNGGAFGYGTVFVMNVTGGLTTLHDFALNDGANPVAELIQAGDGAFYGAASVGGPRGGGVIFSVRVATSTPDRYFEIVSRNSGKCLDVFGASTDAAASVIQWTCHGGPNQQWRLEPTGGGAFRIVARHSGQALDVYGAFIEDATPIIQYPVTGGDNQAWTLEPASDGYVRLVARHSGKAMDVEFASTDDGAPVIQFTPHGGANQQWLLREVDR